MTREIILYHVVFNEEKLPRIIRINKLLAEKAHKPDFSIQAQAWYVSNRTLY